MEALILGAGRVGREIARALVGNDCDVTVVDTNAARLLELQSTCDLRTIHGNAAEPQLLRRIGAADADLIVAVTAIDEVNLVACKICALLSKSTKRIARIRNNALSERAIIGDDGFSISHAFCPEQIVAENFSNAIAYQGCLSVNRFAGGRVALAGVRISAKADIAGGTIEDLRGRVSEIDYRIVSVYRDERPLKPVAETRLFVGDDVYLLVADDNLQELLPFLVGERPKNKRILIAGGGNIGKRVAATFENDREVKIIEVNQERCRQLSEELNNVIILKGRATDEKLLREEDIAETDIFCALTNDDEENVLSAMLAKRLGAKQTAVIVNRAAYIDILERQLDIIMSPSQITIGSVLAHIRLGDVSVVHSLRHGAAEAIEVVVHGDKTTSPIVGRETQQIDWPEGTMPGAIVRNEQIFIAHDDTTVLSGDRLICFVSGREAVKEVEKLMQVNVNFF